MSEFINNREYRQEQLKKIIYKLHEGASVEEVQNDFEILTEGVSATEIAEMEQALVKEGMPIAEIQRLCDVHASVFKGSLQDIHKDAMVPNFEEGHPVHTFKRENRELEKLIEQQIIPSLDKYTVSLSADDKKALKQSLDLLATIDLHYRRKENLVFPFMEQYAITAPPQVMWGVDDEIRAKIKDVREYIANEKMDINQLNEKIKDALSQVKEMIFKEEEIMFPMILDTFATKEWAEIEKGSAEIGFTLIREVKRWSPVKEEENLKEEHVHYGFEDKSILFDAGSLLPEEINAILNTVPLDMTFVDSNNRVKYFTQGKERIFDRPKTIIGREVKNCHPPKSVHIVEEIVKDLKSGLKDHEDFWIRMGENFVYIRYFAVRNKEGKYLGTLEVTQNIQPIQELEGEKRLAN